MVSSGRLLEAFERQSLNFSLRSTEIQYWDAVSGRIGLNEF